MSLQELKQLLKIELPLLPLYRCYLVSIAGRPDVVGAMLAAKFPGTKDLN